MGYVPVAIFQLYSRSAVFAGLYRHALILEQVALFRPQKGKSAIGVVDAMVAALTLNIFQRHTDRIRMVNIAQVVNVLQSMILTDTIGQGHMVLTPTYHVFKMYRDFQEATYLPASVSCDMLTAKPLMYKMTPGKVPTLSVSAAKKQDGGIVVSLVNPQLDKSEPVEIALDGFKGNQVSGTLLTAKDVTDYSDFNHPNVVTTAPFAKAKLKGDTLKATLPPMSIVVLDVR